ncbi:hypothetical protein ELG97_15085 [Rhizobium leguminosarum]|uniref:hypothetical protein n=1 Tax=Rhizobium leguminosarum TaxID=384 RepID=UPI001030FE47|nr:hypothetical protein [Rhizobium leguminosarum]TBE93140.1 hypothetical protein ELG97_15085 [Rhizobium leguminosarum]
MDDGKTRETVTSVPSVGDRLLKLKQLFTLWGKHGVPDGVKYPTSMLGLLDWTEEAHGVYHPLRSKRDINTKSGPNHKVAASVAVLLKALTPEPTKQPEKRVYKTQKAKRVRAENRLEEIEALLDDVTKQWNQRGVDLEATRTLLTYEREHAKRLRKEVDELTEENARLKRELLLHRPGLRVVEQ